jgi:hypothetical protein
VGAPHPMYVTYGVSPPGSTTATAMATALRGFMKTALWDISPRSNQWAMGKCTVNYASAPGIIQVGESAVITNGTSASSDSPPVNAAVLVKKVTGIAGRSNRGRFYFPPWLLAETNVSPTGSIDASAVTTVQGWFTAWFNAMIAATYVPQLFHSSGASATNVTSFSVQQIMATQRLRMRT